VDVGYSPKDENIVVDAVPPLAQLLADTGNLDPRAVIPEGDGGIYIRLSSTLVKKRIDTHCKMEDS
jgi:hypothetical protein